MKQVLSVCLFAITSLNAAAQEGFVFKVAPDAKPGEVIIKGKIGNMQPPMLLTFVLGDDMRENAYDTIPVHNGVFEIKKTALLPAYGAFRIQYPLRPGQQGEPQTQFYTAFFEEGVMEIYSPVDSLRNRAMVKGAALHNQYYRYWNKEGELVKEQRALAKKFNEATPAELQNEKFLADYEKEQEKITAKFDVLIRQEIKDHPYSYATLFAYLAYLRVSNIADPVRANEILNLFPENVRNSKHGAVLKKLADNVGAG